MRNDVMWATDGGPIVGQIKHGKRYDSGNVTEEKYEAGKAEMDEKLAGLQQAVIEMNGTVNQISNSLATLEAQYRTDVPGLAAEIAEIKLDVNNLKNTARTTAEAITRIENKEAGDIQAVTETISTITSGLNALSDLVHEHSTAISLNDTEIQHLKTLLSEVRADLNSNSSGLSALSNTVSELTRTHQVDKATLDERINAVNTALSNLTATVNANAAQTETKISEIRSTLLTATQNIAALQNSFSTIETNVSALQTASSAASQDIAGLKNSSEQTASEITGLKAASSTAGQDIASLKSSVAGINAEIESEKADIQRIESRMTNYEVSQSTLRNQILNVNENLNTRIDVLTQSATIMRSDIKKSEEDIKTLSVSTAQQISALNQRINDMIGREDIDVVSFSASPNICEIGGKENIVLTWITAGDVASQKINGESVTGTSVTKGNVRDDVTYTLVVADPKGKTAEKSVDIKFINHIYYGTSADGNTSASLVKGLENDIFSENRARTISVTCSNEYIYYAFPKRLGGVDFEVSGFVGGFNTPATVRVSNHSEYSEDYYVYRSANKLNGTVRINVIEM